VVPQHIAYILTFLLRLSWENPFIPHTKSYIVHSLGRLTKESIQVQRPLWHFITSLFFVVRVSSPVPNPQGGGPPLVSYVLFEYIHKYLPYLEAISICNLRTWCGDKGNPPPTWNLFI
jgi:hypothetical protein